MLRLVRGALGNREYPGVIAHPCCPFDYCKTDNESLLIRLEEPDELCAFNRAGILCGGCKTGFSIVQGSSRCKTCSNLMVLAIIPSFLLSGLLLVIFLMLLNLTVSIGTDLFFMLMLLELDMPPSSPQIFQTHS